MVTIQSQNFGVEIEMTGVSRGTAASVIANYFGVGGIHFAGGTYQTYEAKDSKGRVWKCMRDGSITPRRRRGGAIVEADDTYRCEVVTPILQYEDIVHHFANGVLCPVIIVTQLFLRLGVAGAEHRGANSCSGASCLGQRCGTDDKGNAAGCGVRGRHGGVGAADVNTMICHSM